jgi:hypothetical protein
MSELASDRPAAIRLPARVRSLSADRVSLALGTVFSLSAAFYLLTAATSKLLTLHGRANDPYNQLANAFLHLHLSIGRAPAALLRLANPYDPTQNKAIVESFHYHDYPIHDFALIHGHLFLTWGPAPVIVLLVPMHLLGFEPSSSLTVAIFAIAGLGFALATLRVLLRQIGVTTMWMCVLAAFALALSSAVPFILRSPNVYEEAVSGGYCFAMAGIWLAISTIAARRASLWRVALMSLCFGLATGSRPTLGLAAVVLVPVYMSLRSTRPRARLLMALVIPLGVCVLLLMTYNQARFGNPLEYGEHYQLADYNPRIADFGDLSNLLPGAWFYTFVPPRPLALFPFIGGPHPPFTDPVGLPAYYEYGVTGGLLPMTPIVIFLLGLPWIWRRRPALLGPLAFPLLVMAGAGMACLLFLSYEFFGASERYEVDFTTLLLFGALAAWLALSNEARGRWRRLVRTGGGILIVWGCLSGLANSFIGAENLLAGTLPGVWATLENIGSPVSSAITAVAGHPVLGEVSAPNRVLGARVRYPSLGEGVSAFRLRAGDQADVTIVSPGVRRATLLASVAPGPALGVGASLWVAIGELGHASYDYPLPARGGVARIPVLLGPGVNHFALSPLASAIRLRNPTTPSTQPLLVVKYLSLANG